jgi:SufS family cysteine desulfurase
LRQGTAPDYYFLPDSPQALPPGVAVTPAINETGKKETAAGQISPEAQNQGGERQNHTKVQPGDLKHNQHGAQNNDIDPAPIEVPPAERPLGLVEQGSGHVPSSETELNRSVTETPPAVPLPPDATTPGFYFLPTAEPAELPVPEDNQGEQPLQLPRDGFDVEAVRRDFPILRQRVHGKPLIWMDNAATSQKPQSVLDAERAFYERDNSNVHRGAHTLAARATNAYEDAREKIQRFLGASSAKEIIFVRGTTEGINLIAQTFGRSRVSAMDEIVLTTLEHHSNLVPWHMLAQEQGAVLKVAPISDRTRIVALSHVSNVLGTVLPIKTMAEMAHRYGATVVVDGAQSVPHFRTNVQELGADFFVFSGHKLFGPTGIGALYGKAALLEQMPLWQGGGNMIKSVSFEEISYNDIPGKFEAGTGSLAAAVGLGSAIDYLNQIGFEAAAKHEEALMAYAMSAMAAIPGLRQIGTAADKVSTLTFTLESISPEDMARFLDREGIAVRSGHHCAQPTMKRFGVASAVRPSLAFYNTFGEVDALIEAILKAKQQLS